MTAFRDPFAQVPLGALLSRYGLKLNRQLGQNFVSDRALLNRIVRLADVRPGDHVIEVGAGAGTLTAALTAAGARVDAIEIDGRLQGLLADRFAAAGDRVHLHFQDALQMDFARLAAERSGEVLKFVSNVPYYITTPLIEQMILSCPRAAALVLMVQKEAGAHLTARRGKAYGPLAVLCQTFGAVESAFDVPPSRFLPPPPVVSSVLVLNRTSAFAEVDPTRFFDFLRSCFMQRRKTLYNNLRASGCLETAVRQAAFESFLQENKFKLSIRPEELSTIQFQALFAKMIKY